MRLRESNRRYILFGMVIFIVIGVLVAKVMAYKQDEQFTKEDLLYQQALMLFENGDYESAATYINELLTLEPNSEVVNYIGGLIAASNNELQQAALLMQKTLEINPHRVEDAMFMLQLGEIFYKAEQYEAAKIVLTRCQESNWSPENFPDYQANVAGLLKSIENM